MMRTTSDDLDRACGRAAAGDGTRAAEPQQVWQVKGLDAPESAVPDPSKGVIYVSNVNGSRAMPTATATSPSCPRTARSSTSTG